MDLPDGASGEWTIDSFVVSEADARFHNMREASRSIVAGEYRRLKRGSVVVMTDTPAEISDHRLFINVAKKSKTVLINGLGLGVALNMILKSNVPEEITVIEKSEDVVRLVAPYINDSRVHVLHADAFEYKPPKNKRYDAVWHDIWDYVSPDNLTGMTKLHRKYGRRCDWQGSWCKGLCQRAKGGGFL